MTWISRVHTAALELSRTPYPTTELDIIMVISNGLPDEYQPVVNALDSLSFEELKLFAVTMRITSLEAQLARSKEKASKVTVAYYAAQSRRDGDGSRGGGKQGPGRQEVSCYNCGGRRHYSDECPSPSQGSVDSENGKDEAAMSARVWDDSEEVLCLF
ncbi:hypothetical protein SCP_0212620 [Sparassis crispa]|uniref:CCHC-type domain-containing protein n=1 Tax=Sparassis crispa TaxID=139825 RepID=A0A401GCZ9_9APHY|nr:hypothetical protein SCP_0212620 [Sparassis crispa]GBE80059.1 hypothetical protein SCP_0212620 [Sparassis crispa]